MVSKNTLTVGIDVGGTFTDLIAIDTGGGGVKLSKVPTTVDNQAIGFMAAIAAAGADPATLQSLVHGSTTTTNALLERKIAVLFTEHDMDVVFGQADRIIVLDRGTLIAGGTPQEVRTNPDVQAVYLGGTH